MKALRKKVFWTVYLSTSGVVFLAVLVYNVSNYFNTRGMLHDAAKSIFVDPRYTDFIIQGFLNNLSSSLILFVIVLIVLYFIVRKITDWIVRPAEEAFNKQKDFIADASHELKTPLSVITASADAMSVNLNNKKYLENIKEESSRMNTLIAKLLTLASTENTETSSLKEDNLSKTIELAALTFEAKALENKRKLLLSVQDNIYLKFNEGEIKQLVEILLDNALEHSKIESSIDLKLYKEGRQVVLEVINEGEGINPGDEEKIFERFYRADKSRSSDSNRYGLGLTIAKNIAENHSAKIYARSEDGQTFFKVIFALSNSK